MDLLSLVATEKTQVLVNTILISGLQSQILQHPGLANLKDKNSVVEAKELEIGQGLDNLSRVIH